MRKAFILILFLGLCLSACNLQAQIATPTQTQPPASTSTPLPSLTPTFTPSLTPTITPTATIASKYPLITVPIEAIQVMDDDLQRQTRITAMQVRAWVSKANEIYARAGISFTFNDLDFTYVQSSLLNHITGTGDPNWFEEIAYGDKLAANYPDKLVLFFRWGPDAGATGGGFSSVDYNFVAMPGFLTTKVCGYQNIGLLAHEISHYLGLSHTFAKVYTSVAEAEAALKSNNNDPSVFDGDGFSDTLPDPFVALDEYQCKSVPGITLNGTFLPVPRENIMSYYEVRTGLSDMQIDRVRWALTMRMVHGMSMPKNAQAPNPQEAQDLSLLSYSGCSTLIQDMDTWGKQQWLNGNQLFVTSGKNCSLSLGLPVKVAGKYRLDLYLTSAPDFGQIQVSLDGKPVSNPIDLYAPMVLPTGAIPVGIFTLDQQIHRLTFQVVGTNPKSNNYSFGMDCFSLVPQQ